MESQNITSKNLIETIEFQNRDGNVATTKLYIVELASDSTFRYNKTTIGQGMLCDTNKSNGACETETESGYEEVDLEISTSEYRKQEEGFSTKYYLYSKTCAYKPSDNSIEIDGCRQVG